jgi:hypothetical protein
MKPNTATSFWPTEGSQGCSAVAKITLAGHGTSSLIEISLSDTPLPWWQCTHNNSCCRTCASCHSCAGLSHTTLDAGCACSKIAEAEAAVSVNEKKWLVMDAGCAWAV